MTLNELCVWLRENSIGIYKPSADAADEIEALSEALIDIMDGMKDHDIAEETGLGPADCERIADVRRRAKQLMKDMAARD